MQTTNIITQIMTLRDVDFPESLGRAHPAVRTLYIRNCPVDGEVLAGWTNLMSRPRVAIVGSRKISAYGKAATHRIAFDLARAGVVIVSGLAYGVDACAHRAALEAGGQTIAVLPSSVEQVYPAGHAHLAEQIIAQGGALVSEYPTNTVPYPGNFIARNRIVVALSSIIVVTEATFKSGTLHTARFALEQGIDVMAVPGNITSPTSQGTNTLLRSGAGVATSAEDVCHILGIAPQNTLVRPQSGNPNEQRLIDLMAQGISDGGLLLAESGLSVQTYNQALTMLEISGIVRALGGNRWQLC